MSQFNSDNPRITAYVLGELDSQQMLEFETELSASPELQTAVEEVRETVGRLESAFQAELNGADEPIRPIGSQQMLPDSRAARNGWVFSVVAATVMIGIGVGVAMPLFSPVREARRESASRSDSRELLAADGPKSTVGIGDIDEFDVSEEVPPLSFEPIPGEAQAPGEARAESDLLIDRVVEEVAPSPWEAVEGEGSIQEFPSNLSLVTSASEVDENQGDGSNPVSASADSDLMMMVTPEIIIAEEEEARLVDGDDPLGSVVAESAVTDFGVTANGPSEDPLSDQYHRGSPVPDGTDKATIASATRRTRGGRMSGRGNVNESLVEAEKLIGLHIVGESLPKSRTMSIVNEQQVARDELVQLELHREQLVAKFGNRHPELAKLSKQLTSIEQRVAQLQEDDSELHLQGRGPGNGGDKFDPIHENEFLEVKDSPLSTFSIDVDTASYSKTRQFLMDANSLPRPDSVRIEELLNYFTYDYEEPKTDDPFWANTEVAACPWAPKHRLVRIGLQGKTFPKEERPPTNLVFLLDVSGSMDQPNKLPLLRRSMKLLVEQLGENDRVAITVYAGAAGKVLESTTADNQDEILSALERLHAGGSTNGGAGIHLAYQTALDNFNKGGVNRVILCTDGDFNVGTTGTDELVRLAEENAKTGVFLSVFGFGMGNHNDSMLEQISNKGNGNYGFIDNDREAKKSFVEQMAGTLITIAKDVKIQIEFNPLIVSSYRLIGYENRVLAARDFNDDTKDAGEIGAGHTVTALYEIVPVGTTSDVNSPPVDDLKYQKTPVPSEDASSGELLTLKLRYKQPDGDKSKLLVFPVKDDEKSYAQSSKDYRFAASVASFGMLLRNSKYKGNSSWDSVLELATEGSRDSDDAYRSEFIEMVKKAKSLSGE